MRGASGAGWLGGMRFMASRCFGGGVLSFVVMRFVCAFVRTCVLVHSGLFFEGSGGVSCDLVGVLVRLVRWRGVWAFIVVCASGWVGSTKWRCRHA